MAQLTDDCFAFSGPLLRLDDMERLIGERVTPVAEIERVPLHGARGRVIADDVKAPVNLPPFDNSAVDGYAVRHADLRPDGDTTLVVAGRLMAGARENLSLKPGEAIRIFTGAAMPVGADTVFMQEDVKADDGRVTVPKGLKLGANRRLAGEDVPAGGIVLSAGTVLEAQHVALAAALGLTELAVRRRLKVAIFSTGDEVVEPGSTRGAATIFDSNRVLLTELLERLGAVVTDLGILADDPDKLSAKLRQAASGHDLIITSGGVSTGEADYVRKAVESIGNAGVLARCDQAGPAGGAWRDPVRSRAQRGLRRPARQPGGGLRDLRARGEAVAAAPFRRPAGQDRAVAGAGRLRLQEKERPPRICPRGPQACRGW